MDHAVKKMGRRGGKYLTFSLDSEEYGIEITKVKEIIAMVRITPVPRTPDYVRGVINFRGKVIPVIDLRLRFGLEALDYSERTCIIVVEIASFSGKLPMGIVVDAVSGVLNVQGPDIEAPPTFSAGLETDYILGMVAMGGRIKILIDIGRILDAMDLTVPGRVA